MFCLILLLLVPFINGEKVVHTKSGPIRGISMDAENVDAFLGIPYAEPPLGNLRFAKPVPKKNWTEIFNATELPPACLQYMSITSKLTNQEKKMDEDCLYLNLWVPKNNSTQKPIMVFIHGGSFMTGSSNIKIYDGTKLSQHGDVIVASMNYRVGTLGFFSAFVDDAAGNMGMYDQVLAIQWIQDNANYFGGDPNNIVLFGESAGAFSVSLHMVSPLSKHLFNRAILQSGAAVHPMYSNDNNVLRMGSQTISKLLGCANTDEDFKEKPGNIVKCMKALPPERFSEADKEFHQKYHAMLIPRVGDEFLPLNPTDLFRKGEIKDSEVLLGVTRDEGSMFVAFQLSNKNGEMLDETVDADGFNETLAKQIFQMLPNYERYSKVAENYLKRVKEQSRYTYLRALSDIIGDSMITCPTLFHADFQSRKNNSVYFYLFDYRTSSSQFPEWAGVPHFEETPYVFGNPIIKPFSKMEEVLSKDIMDMWLAFSKTGNPSIPGGLKWPEYTFDDPKYLIIGMRDKIGLKPDNYRCEAWRNLYRATMDEESVQIRI